MKIGILTYNFVINPGSSLQTYCLLGLLKQNFPNCKVEVINYHSPRLFFKELRKLLTKRPPFLNLEEIYKYIRIKAFLRKNITLSKKLLFTDNLDKLKEHLSREGYSAIVVGSDTVFEVRENGGSPLAPNIYFLPIEGKFKKISFAASFDKTNESLLFEKDIHNDLKPLLNNFDFLSLRDENSFRICKKIGVDGSRIKFMPDPSLIYDFYSLNIPSTFGFNLNGKIAGVALSNVDLKKKLVQVLINEGYDVINLLGKKIENAVELPASFSYENFLWVHKRIDLLITDRFHGSIIGIKMNLSPTIFIENNNKKNSKGRDLFKRLEIEHVVFSANDAENIKERDIRLCINYWKESKSRLEKNLNQLHIMGIENLNDIKKIVFDGM
tara:strand:- start:556 stop:1704 length:1149 start_codon:yes stop_codon:yes gene_type:complete